MNCSWTDKVRIGFWAVLLLLVGIPALTLFSVRNFKLAAAAQQQSYETILLVERLMDSLRDARTGQRTYLLTRDPAELLAYQQEFASVLPRLQTLEAWTKDLPEQASRVSAVRGLIEQKLAMLADAVAAAQDPQRGSAAAVEIVRSDRGAQLMEDIRQQVDALQAAEAEHRVALRAWADAAANHILTTVICGAVAAWLVASLAARAVTRNLAGHQELEDRLRLNNDELEMRVVDRTAELADSNQQLRAENAERLLAQEAAKWAEAELRRLNGDLEQRVAERTAQLEAAMRELEAFSYSVSHDLRAPLRAIEGFSQALLEDYASALDDTGQEHLQRISRATARMAQLIDDLLNLSRVSRTQLTRERVDLTSVAREVTAELQQREPERQVAVAVSPGAIAEGDPRLLRIVLENLLGNAWKFTSKRPRARIEFGIDGDAGRRTFFVRDNGAGFDMAFATRLFGPFQRLHNAAEFAGTGIGLATVQRVIQRHGGRVWARSAVGEGATFFFSL